MRKAVITRDTNETQISVALNVDGKGAYECATGVGFLDHMLALFTRHGRFDLSVNAKGDTHVDAHHTVEDIGIVLGSSFAQALGNLRGVVRYGSFLMPMDEALVQIVVDLSGRGCLSYGLQIPAQKVGEFDTELVEEFFLAFTRTLGFTLHIRQLAGTNSHHIIEAAFKGLGRALAQAVALDEHNPDEIPSTKGTLR